MAEPSGYKLEVVQVLFRHGARTPAKNEVLLAMPTFVDHSFVDDYGGYDQLTNVGKEQAYKLGCVLRGRYDDFLGAVYRPQDLHARSSDTDRTKMTLQLVLAGLYPPPPEQTWNSDLAWMPIPTYYLPEDFDFLLRGFQKPKYQELLKDAFQTLPQFQHELSKTIEEFNEFFKEQGIYSLDKLGFYGCMGIFNILSTHKTSNVRLPDWFTDDLYENLKRHVCVYFDLLMSTIEMGKIFIGSLIKQFIANMNLNGEIHNPRKMYLYSGHEINIAPFTRAHHIHDFRYPDYANAVILEKLRNSQNQVFVRILAWTGKEFITLKLGNFQEFCPIDEYLKLIEYIIPSDEEIDKMLSEMNIDVKKICTTDSIFCPKRKLF